MTSKLLDEIISQDNEFMIVQELKTCFAIYQKNKGSLAPVVVLKPRTNIPVEISFDGSACMRVEELNPFIQRLEKASEIAKILNDEYQCKFCSWKD